MGKARGYQDSDMAPFSFQCEYQMIIKTLYIFHKIVDVKIMTLEDSARKKNNKGLVLLLKKQNNILGWPKSLFVFL